MITFFLFCSFSIQGFLGALTQPKAKSRKRFVSWFNQQLRREPEMSYLILPQQFRDIGGKAMPQRSHVAKGAPSCKRCARGLTLGKGIGGKPMDYESMLVPFWGFNKPLQRIWFVEAFWWTPPLLEQLKGVDACVGREGVAGGRGKCQKVSLW